MVIANTIGNDGANALIAALNKHPVLKGVGLESAKSSAATLFTFLSKFLLSEKTCGCDEALYLKLGNR